MQIRIGGGHRARGFRIAQLMHELERMPEYELYRQLQGFSMSIYIFDQNYVELRQFITFLATDPRATPLFWLRNRDRMMSAMNNIVRLLHNFVASSISLIDHTRRLFSRLYADTDRFPDYEARVSSDFVHDPLSQFVNCLRQYCQHYRSPNLSATVSWQQGDGRETKTFSLSKGDLLAFDGWSSTAKKYLEKTGGEVEVLRVATEYRGKVIAFYQWFQSRQEQIHAEEIRRFKQKEAQLLLLMLEERIDMSFAESEQGLPHRKDDIFCSIFTSREFSELESIPRDSPRRPARAIELLEERFFLISDEVKHSITQLYQLPDIVPPEQVA